MAIYIDTGNGKIDLLENEAVFLATVSTMIDMMARKTGTMPSDYIRRMWIANSEVNGVELSENLTQIHMLMDRLAEQFHVTPAYLLSKMCQVRDAIDAEGAGNANSGQIPQ